MEMPLVAEPVDDTAEDYDPQVDEFFTHDWSKMPRCQEQGCKSYLRPDAVLFMESLPQHAWSKAERAVSSVRFPS